MIRGVADPAIFDESRGESIAAMMERPPNGVHWAAADNTRLAGKMQMHYRLAFDGEGRPMFQVFRTCRHFIRTIPSLVYDREQRGRCGHPSGGPHLRRVPVCFDGKPHQPAVPARAAAPPLTTRWTCSRNGKAMRILQKLR